MLCHSGVTRIEATIRQHLTWPGLRDHVLACIQTCDSCQRNKTKGYLGHLLAKNAEAQLWEVLCVDLIGSYQIRRKGKKPLRLRAVTMIDPATRWFEVAEIPNKEPISYSSRIGRQRLVLSQSKTKKVHTQLLIGIHWTILSRVD